MGLERPTGCLDAPAQGREVAGPAVHVSGWVVFPDAPTDIVEVFLDGEAVAHARLGNSRVDVLRIFPEEGVNALASGFHTVVPVPISGDDTEHRVHVRATSYNGGLWEPPPADFVVTGVKEKELPTSPFASRLTPIQKPTPAKPRWCVFTHSLKLGGGQLYLQELLIRVARSGAAEILLISPEDGPLRPALEAEGIGVHVTAGYVVDPEKYEGGLVELALLMREWRADIVVINTLAVFPPADAALRMGLPVIWAIHESFSLDLFDFVCWGPGGLAPAVRERWLLALKSAELVYEADSTLELHLRDIPSARAHKIPYGVDLDATDAYLSSHDRAAMREHLGFSTDERILLCVGTIEDRKAQIPLLRAFVEASVGHASARIVFVGGSDSPYARALKDSVTLLDAEDSITIIDVDPDVYRWYLVADVLVSASDVESMPRSFMEAQAFGLPILAADVFGVGEVVRDGVNGWLFRPQVASAMTAAVRRVLRISDTELQRLSANARACSVHYSGSGYAQAYVELASCLLEAEKTFGRSRPDTGRESMEAVNG
jgi:glycosyltransferase involved in cell wall biosynthesis